MPSRYGGRGGRGGARRRGHGGTRTDRPTDGLHRYGRASCACVRAAGRRVRRSALGGADEDWSRRAGTIWTTRSGIGGTWHEQQYHGVVFCALGWACWKASAGNGLGSTESMTSLGPVYPVHNATRTRPRASWLRMKAAKAVSNVTFSPSGRLANTYQDLGRSEEALPAPTRLRTRRGALKTPGRSNYAGHEGSRTWGQVRQKLPEALCAMSALRCAGTTRRRSTRTTAVRSTRISAGPIGRSQAYALNGQRAAARRDETRLRTDSSLRERERRFKVGDRVKCCVDEGRWATRHRAVVHSRIAARRLRTVGQVELDEDILLLLQYPDSDKL